MSDLPSISADGNRVAFRSIATNLASGLTAHIGNIFVHDIRSGTTTCVSKTPDGNPATYDSSYPRISANGRFVVFTSNIDGKGQVYVSDTVTQTVSFVSNSSLNAGGSSGGGSISDDGRFITYVFLTATTNSVVLSDSVQGLNLQVANPLHRPAGLFNTANYSNAFISGDGRFVALNVDATDLVAGDSNSFYDVFIRRLLIP